MGSGIITRRVGELVKDIANAEVVLEFSSITYDTREHAPKITSVTLDGEQLRDMLDYYAVITPQTNAGEHSILLRGIGGYGGAKEVKWRIEKAQGSIRVEPPQITIQGAAGTTAELQIIYTGDGEITVSSSEYVTAEIVDGKLKLTSLQEGRDTLTVNLEDGVNYVGGGVRVEVEVKFASAVLEENSWETIASVAASGKASEIWSVGNIKKITLTGNDAGTYGVQIIGFGQDVLDTSDARCNDPTYNGGSNKAAITFQFVELLKTYYQMHTSDNNSCSWERSNMRVTTMPLVLGEMPSDVKGVMRTVTKKAPQSTSNKNLISTADKLFLLGPHEVFKSPIYADFTAEGELYTYYASGNSTVKNQLGGSAYRWWLRCPATDGSKYFCLVSTIGGGSAGAAIRYGVAAAFCI